MGVLLSLVNVMRKELIQTLRDRRMVFTLMLAPLIQLVMFGYAVNLDVDHIPTIVCDQDRTPESRDLVAQLLADGTFRRDIETMDPEVAQRALDSGEAAVAVVVPRGFAVRFARRDAPQVQVLIDGTDSTRAQVAANDASQFLLLHGIGGTGMGASVPAGPAIMAAPLEPRILYNPRLKTPVYMLPGILATLLLNVTAVVTAMGLSRERETGTLEQILVTPIRPAVLLAGKCLPFTLFGLVTVLAVMLLGSWLFDVPIRGSLAVVGVGAFLYLFSTLGIGVLIAAFSPSQQQAMLGAFGFILPAMLLSGFVSPVSSMPAWLRPLTALLPMRHFLEIMRGCLLKGAGFADLAPQLLALAVLGVGILWASVARFRKRLA
jgi:ABC-2 type transport system permease protein